MKQKLQRLVAWAKAHPKKSIAGGLILLAVLGGGTYWLLAGQQSPIATVVNKAKAKKKVPTTKASPLSGVVVANELADRPVSAVVIENHPEARPQSGLSQAGIVYEALAEGGITRFLAFFLENRPNPIGPVRSLRTYFVDWALEFDAPVSHVGGSAAALAMVKPTGMKDINQFYNASTFYRTRDRYAPHNVYTDFDRLDALMRRNGFFTPAKFTPNPRKKDKPAPTNPIIGINYSYNGYQVEYRYVAATNNYARFLAGAPHVERTTGQQLMVKNVVVEFMPTTYGRTPKGTPTVSMATPGSGKALVFRDGGVIVGTWSKSDHRSRTKLLDAAGKEIKLNRGNTWFSIVPPDKSVTY